MKTLHLGSLKVPVLFLLSLIPGLYPAWSQSRFEGIIRYRISNQDIIQENAPKVMEYYLKENNLMFRVYTYSGNELARILLKGDEKVFFMIDDEQKTAMKLKLEQEAQEQPGIIPEQYEEAYRKAIEEEKIKNKRNQQDIKYTGETDMIAGYVCKKYEVSFVDLEKRSDAFVWLTDEINFSLPESMISDGNPLFQFLGSSGFPLKLKIAEGEVFMDMEATEVVKKKLRDVTFIIPPDYQISDLSSLMQGN